MNLLQTAMQREWNAHVSLDPVSVEGYSQSDLSGYYVNTYLLWESDEGCQPVLVRDLETRDTSWIVRTLDDPAVSVPVTQLKRMVIPVGFYIIDGYLQSYRYVLNRSYKKGLAVDFARVSKVGKSQRHAELSDFVQMLYPLNEKGSTTVVKRRLAIHESKLLTHYKTMSVGSYKNGETDTPFPCIKQRLEEHHA